MPLTIDPLSEDCAVVELNASQYANYMDGSPLEDLIKGFDKKIENGQAKVESGRVKAFFLVIKLTNDVDEEVEED